MQEKARVVAIDGEIISVVPLEIEACINCNNSECKKNGNMFKAVNKRGMELSVGSQIRVAAPAKNQLIQGLVSIGVPVALAVFAYNGVSVIFPAPGDGVRVGVALLALGIGCAVMLVAVRPGKKGLPEVIELY